MWAQAQSGSIGNAISATVSKSVTATVRPRRRASAAIAAASVLFPLAIGPEIRINRGNAPPVTAPNLLGDIRLPHCDVASETGSCQTQCAGGVGSNSRVSMLARKR